MERTLILYHNTLKDMKLLDLFEKVLGPADKREWGEFHEDILSTSIALIIPLDRNDILSYLRLFLDNHKEKFVNKRIALIFISTKSTPIVENEVYSEISPYFSECFVFAEYFTQENGNQEEMTRKLIHIKRNLLDHSDMPRERLIEEVKRVLNAHNTCTLCTGGEHSLRATPIEYTYNMKNDSLYFLSEGGEKFAYIAANTQVALAIYHEFNGFDKLEGLQVEGIVEKIELFSLEYNENIIQRGLTPAILEKLPSKLNMFKVIPKRICLLKSELKRQGYHARQVLDFNE